MVRVKAMRGNACRTRTFRANAHALVSAWSLDTLPNRRQEIAIRYFAGEEFEMKKAEGVQTLLS